MNAALFQTTFWHWVLVTDGRRRLFTSIDERRHVQLWVKEIARGKGIGVHQVNAQDEHLHAFFELPEGMDERAGELFSYAKATLEKALLAKNPDLLRVFDGRNFFERVELGAFGAVQDYVKEQDRHHSQAAV